MLEINLFHYFVFFENSVDPFAEFLVLTFLGITLGIPEQKIQKIIIWYIKYGQILKYGKFASYDSYV